MSPRQSGSSNYDVIISGGGPVGLFLACELALAKCSVLVLEKSAAPESPLKKLPFGIRGLSAPSIEALYRRGLLNELEVHKHIKNPHMNAAVGSKRQLGHFAGIPLLEGNIDVSQWKFRRTSSTALSLISEMQELETIFARRAESLGVTIQRGLAVSGFQQNKDGMLVQAGDLSFTGKWLIGCDGARSIVRKLGGFEFAGTEPEFTGYTTLIDIANPEVLKPGRVMTARGMYMQSQPGYIVIQDFDGGAFHGSDKTLTLEHVQNILREVSGTDVKINRLHVATTWTDRARQATRYRNGRVLLAGDAAHIHSPLGGQGLNLGLGDAMNLGWKLAAIIKDPTRESLLDTYETERHPVGEQVMDWSRAQVAIMKPDASSRALNAVMRDLINTRDGATYMAGKVWGVFTHYAFGDAHPLLGYSAPNFEFGDGRKMGELLREGEGVLLDFRSDAALKNLAQQFSDLKYVAASSEEHFDVMAALIRPDGIIVWATNDTVDVPSLQQACVRWFAKAN